MLRSICYTFIISLLLWPLALQAAQLDWKTTQTRIQLAPGETEARYVYTATNQGDAPVRVSEVKTSCGCTGSLLKNRLVRPGETVEVTAIFQKGKRTGLNRNKLEVYVEGEKAPVVTLEMIVDIPEMIQAKPRIVYWKPDSTRTPRTVRLSLSEDYDLSFGAIKYDESLINIQALDSDNPDKEMRLEISPKNYDKSLRTMLTVESIGPGKNKESTRIHIFVQP